MSSSDAAKAAIASKLRQARERAGLSQSQVAALLNMHRPSISEIEAARRNVTAEELSKFADIYSVSLDWLTSFRAASMSPQIEMAARELAKLKSSDLDNLLNLLSSLRMESEKE